MKKNRHRGRNPSAPLTATLADHLGPDPLRMPRPEPRQLPRMPTPPRSTRDVLALLTAATGLCLAARPDAQVELLPGTPTTVLITADGKAHAAFVLPVEPAEVLRALGQPAPHRPVPELDQLWEEQRQADLLDPRPT